LNSFYTSARQYGNQILVRGVKDGKRYLDRQKFKPTLYTLKNSPSKFNSLQGEPLVAHKFDSINDAKEYVKKYEGIRNFKIFGNTAYQFQWVNETHNGLIEYDPDLIKTSTVDIETTVNHGFPDYFNPIEEITLISVKDRVTKEVTTFGCWDYTPKKDNVTYVKCDNEKELLMEFLSFWEEDYPDIITGWNTDEFDIVYTIERMKRVIGEDNTKRLSPFGIIRGREYDQLGQKKMEYEIFGIASLDYLRLYKKFADEKRESYKLDFIGEVELGMNKNENPYPSFKEWYENDPESFIDYNIVDTDIVDGLEDKLSFIALAISLAYKAKINFDDVFSPVKMWDTIIYNHLLDQNIVVPFKDESFHEEKSIEGAFVKDPIPGLYKNVASFDLASLYPHIIMALNMSPETIHDTMVDVDVKTLLEGAYNVIEGFSLAPNGSMYDMSKAGFLPALMKYYYSERKIVKKEMLKLKSQLEISRETLLPEDRRYLENRIATLHALQLALKIALNSAYGALAQKSFRFFDTRIAEGITMSGQLIIQHAEHAANNMLNKILNTDKDYVIACDTDSAYLNLESFVEKFCNGKTVDQKIDFMMKVCDGKFQTELNDSCDKLSISMNWKTGLIAFKREAICTAGVWTGKKRYALMVYDNEGVRYAEPQLKVTGLSVVSSGTPKCVKEPLRDCIRQILTGDEKTLQAFVKEQETRYMDLMPDVISFPKGVNNLMKYTSHNEIYTKGTPIGVRAALLHNHLVNTKSLSNYELIKEGGKIRFLYLKEPNILRENVIGFVDHLPPEFGLTQYVDYPLMWEKSFIAPLKKITDAVGWNYEEKNTLDTLFE
jgi:DNA polymerase elongation subunit (family B)